MSRDQYNFVDMTGQTIRGVRVESRARNLASNACWNVVFACGHRGSIQGIALRAADKESNAPLKCRACRPRRAGTVLRRVRV